MHQCDICCWYVSDARGCECPLVMREKACEEARLKASNVNTVKKDSSKNKSDSINVEDVVVKRVEILKSQSKHAVIVISTTNQQRQPIIINLECILHIRIVQNVVIRTYPRGTYGDEDYSLL